MFVELQVEIISVSRIKTTQTHITQTKPYTTQQPQARDGQDIKQTQHD